MTPAVEAAQKAAITFTVHHYAHDPNSPSYGLEAAEKLGIAPERVGKTLVTEVHGVGCVIAVLPVAAQLDLKGLARAIGAKKAAIADPAVAARATGYILGGISPLGQKKRLPTIIDESLRRFSSIFVSGGRRGVELELAPEELVATTRATWAPISRN